MKLDRNENDDGCGKYALINLRKLNNVAGHPSTFERWSPAVAKALAVLEECGALEWGQVGSESEFFLIKLKDIHALAALRAYSFHALPLDREWSYEVLELCTRAGINSPFCKRPD